VPNLSSKPTLARSVLRKIFLEDWALKAFALVITLSLWFGVTIVSKGKEATGRFVVPLNFRLSDNSAVTSAPVQEVEIRVRGRDDVVDQIRRNDLVVYVDLSDSAPGERTVTLTPETVSIPLPDGAKVVDLQPSRIAVTVERVEEREVAVKPVTTGALPAGYELYGQPIVIPSRVKVRGPASLMAEIDELLTDKVSLNGWRENFTARQVPVYAANGKVTIYNTVVDVDFRVGEKRVERSFMLTSTTGRTANVTVFGPRSALAKMKPTDLRFEVGKDAAGADTPLVTLPVELQDTVEITKTRLN
jgi:YbbR domain-containing protein